jgi:hypothetical protein
MKGECAMSECMERVARLSEKQFVDEYVSNAKPVVITHGMRERGGRIGEQESLRAGDARRDLLRSQHAAYRIFPPVVPGPPDAGHGGEKGSPVWPRSDRLRVSLSCLEASSNSSRVNLTNIDLDIFPRLRQAKHLDAVLISRGHALHRDPLTSFRRRDPVERIAHLLRGCGLLKLGRSHAPARAVFSETRSPRRGSGHVGPSPVTRAEDARGLPILVRAADVHGLEPFPRTYGYRREAR